MKDLGFLKTIREDKSTKGELKAQATDRASRIGQTKNVMVYRLINQGTMEEKIDEMIRSKRDLANMSITTGETWLGDLSNADLKNLVQLTKM